MPRTVLSVVRFGKRWGVSADGVVMAIAQRKRDAERLAASSARTLRDSGYEIQLAPLDFRRRPAGGE